VKSAEAHNGLDWHCAQKDKNSCELSLVESNSVSAAADITVELHRN